MLGAFTNKNTGTPNETNGKLLEMADRDEDGGPANADIEEPEIPSTSEMASVITQVTKLDINTHQTANASSDDIDSKGNWKYKFRYARSSFHRSD